MAGERPQVVERQRLEAALDALAVDDGGEVRRRIGERAVEIEQGEAKFLHGVFSQDDGKPSDS